MAHYEFLPALFRFRWRCSPYVRRTATLVDMGGPVGDADAHMPARGLPDVQNFPERASRLTQQVRDMQEENPLTALEVGTFLDVLGANINDASMCRFVADLRMFADQVLSVLSKEQKTDADYGTLATSAEIGLYFYGRRPAAFAYTTPDTAHGFIGLDWDSLSDEDLRILLRREMAAPRD